MRRAGSRRPCRRCIHNHRRHHPDDHDHPPLTTEEIALEALLGKTVGACSRDLARVGPPPSDRLQPVYRLATKACQQFTKAARCHATVVRLSLPSGGVVVGSLQKGRARPARSGEEAAPVGFGDGGRPVAHAQLLVDVQQVGLDGGLADEQLGRGLAVGGAVGDQSQHF